MQAQALPLAGRYELEDDAVADWLVRSLELEDEPEEPLLDESLEVSEPVDEELPVESLPEPELEEEPLLDVLSDELEEPLDVSEPEEDDELDSCELEPCACWLVAVLEDSASVSALFSVVSFSLSLDCCVSVGVEAEVEAASFALVCAVVVLGDDSTSVLPQP